MLAVRGKYHEKYLQYRVLSETTRAQFYLSASGSDANISSAFTWTQKLDSAWIRAAVSAVLAGAPEENGVSTDEIKKVWIDGQLEYHEKAYKSDRKKQLFNEGVTKIMLIISVLLYALVIVLEFFFDGAITAMLAQDPFPAALMHHEGQDLMLRGLLKIILGGISAVTLFLANYYGKLSFERKSVDHKKMAMLYASAKNKLKNGGADEKALFYELAREEIIENANWFSYCRENPPSLNI